MGAYIFKRIEADLYLIKVTSYDEYVDVNAKMKSQGRLNEKQGTLTVTFQLILITITRFITNSH
jgi:hypothetical protein